MLAILHVKMLAILPANNDLKRSIARDLLANIRLRWKPLASTNTPAY